MKIRLGSIDDLLELQQLFVETIEIVCKADYTNQQIKAWTSGIENKQRWQDILTKHIVFVAIESEIISGFCSLDKGNHIDLFYVHKDFQRRGVAKTLYTSIVNEAKRQRQIELTSDVSKTAKPFYEKMGFKVVRKQIVMVKGVEFINYKMNKKLE
ncbi:MAG: GNAT family N-acetyltransferase [Bacteroidia bacterium]